MACRTTSATAVFAIAIMLGMIAVAEAAPDEGPRWPSIYEPQWPDITGKGEATGYDELIAKDLIGRGHKVALKPLNSGVVYITMSLTRFSPTSTYFRSP